MKFDKEFRAQMIQEWREAYMNYTSLKKILKEISISKNKNQNDQPSVEIQSTRTGLPKRTNSLYKVFSGLSKIKGSPTKKTGDIEEEIILVDDDGTGQSQYSTLFFNITEEGGETEMMFFRILDAEFNKVLRFYENKVGELVGEADELSRQMNALIALRVQVEKPVYQRKQDVDKIEEVEMSIESGERKENGKEPEDFEPAPVDILNYVKINVKPETLLSTLISTLKVLKTSKNSSKRELKKVEELMSQAFVEFYQKLRSLKSFCFLNQLGFTKIMKKYDKTTSRKASKVYLQTVNNSYLGSSDEVTKLMERVEITYIKHFANGNRRDGMKILRPKHKKERHTTTYVLGFLSGFAIALTVALIVLIHARDIVNSEGRHQYMENIFPLYSFFGFIALHLLMYGGNIYFWIRYRVNYPFIFGFKQGTELGYREVILISCGLLVLTLAGVISNLDMEMDPRTMSYSAITELAPLGLLVVLLLIAICPLNIIYKSSRYFLLGCLVRSFLAPLYKVTLPDFFVADQLTSQVQAFRSLEFYICYYGWGDFTRRSNNCQENHIYRIFYLIVAMIPYLSRFFQCLRRLVEEKDSSQGYNSLKYLSTILAVAARTMYDLGRGETWLIVATITSIVATIFNTYWDIVMDWGLLRRNSKNPYLRDKLLVQNKSVYYIAMVVNVVLRLAWMQTVLGIREAPFLHRHALTAIVACLEIIRRGLWNFFRLENEHLNNVGKFRAFKSVPLPFQYESKDE